MKKFIHVSIFLPSLASIVFAVDSDIVKHSSCTYCGMEERNMITAGF